MKRSQWMDRAEHPLPGVLDGEQALGCVVIVGLGRHAGPVSVTLFAGAGPSDADATGASGGLVRGFETDPGLCLAAAESLAEIRASRTLRDWSGYREVGSVYLMPRRLLPVARTAGGQRDRHPERE